MKSGGAWRSYVDDPVQIAMHMRIFDDESGDVVEEAEWEKD